MSRFNEYLEMVGPREKAENMRKAAEKHPGDKELQKALIDMLENPSAGGPAQKKYIELLGKRKSGQESSKDEKESEKNRQRDILLKERTYSQEREKRINNYSR